MYSDKIYPYFSKYLSIFEKKKTRKQQQELKNYDIILFGYDRVGCDLLKSFKKLKKKILIVDYNPETILELNKKKIECRYGDVADEEFLSELNLSKTKIIVSTIPELETNLLLINSTRQTNKKTIIITTAHNDEEAREIYKSGATYVIMPHFLGGSYASKMIDKYKLDINKFIKEKKKHIKHLKKKK